MARFPVSLATVLKLVAASIVVGAVLSFLGITADDILARATAAVSDVVANFGHWAGRFGSWLMLGAVVVVPIWLLTVAWRAVKTRGAR